MPILQKCQVLGSCIFMKSDVMDWCNRSGLWVWKKAQVIVARLPKSKSSKNFESIHRSEKRK